MMNINPFWGLKKFFNLCYPGIEGFYIPWYCGAGSQNLAWVYHYKHLEKAMLSQLDCPCTHC
jgi:hypothetical protein